MIYRMADRPSFFMRFSIYIYSVVNYICSVVNYIRNMITF